MKRTINEIYELICEKIENAERDLKALVNETKSLIITDLKAEIKGEIQAYTDIKILLETSEVLNNGKD